MTLQVIVRWTPGPAEEGHFVIKSLRYQCTCASLELVVYLLAFTYRAVSFLRSILMFTPRASEIER